MDSKTQDLLQKLAEITFSLDKDIAELKVSIAALTAVAASLLTPDDPSVGEEHIHLLQRYCEEGSCVRFAQRKKAKEWWSANRADLAPRNWTT